MTDITLSYVSPLGTLASSEHERLLARLDLGCVVIRGDQANPATARTVGKLGIKKPPSTLQLSSSAAGLCLWQSPDEWLLLLAREEVEDFCARAQTAFVGEHLTVVDLSGQYSVLQCQHPRWRDLFAQFCFYDFSLTNFPVGKVVNTVMDATSVVVAHAEAEQPLLLIRNSYARYITGLLLEAPLSAND